MRICYLCPDRGIPLDGHKGASAHVRGFARAAARLGHDVRVLTPEPGAPPPRGLHAVRIPTPSISREVGSLVPPRIGRALAHLWGNVELERTLRHALSRFQPQLVYERHSPFSVAGTLVARQAGIAHVLEVNAPLAWEGSTYRRQAMPDAADAIERAALAHAGRIVAVSEELRSWLIASGVDGDRVSVLPNGVDASLFTPPGSVRRVAPRSRTVLGFVGSLKPWHGLDVLASAFRRLADDPRYHLLAVGEGPAGGVLEALAAELPGRVTLAGAVPHERIPELLRGIDVALAPYPASEAFYFSPLKVLEYMAVGAPVVASGIGQLRELVRDGVTGVLVPPGRVDALVEAVRDLARDPDRRLALGRAAAAEVAGAHTWEHRVASVLELASSQVAVTAAAAEEVACSP